MIRESHPGGLPTGQAVITTGGKLKAKNVIHTVGPVWHDGKNNEQQKLADAYKNSLKVAIENGIRTISFPSISTGAYGYPVEKASTVAIRAVFEFLEENPVIEEVRFVLHSDHDLKIYEKASGKFSI